MLTVLALFCIISSGGLFISSFFGRRYEESAPLSVFGLIVILYVFGLIHLLRLGVYVICATSIALLVAVVNHEVIKKQWRAFFSRTLTPAFFIFLAATCAIALITFGRLISGWDEYSHWAYIVKTMAIVNDFGTNPAAHALYPGYPPAIPLFQYFAVVLNGGYTEWLLYAAYLIAATTLFLPFLKKLTFRTLALNLIVCGLIIIVPSLFFFDYYANLQVDSFMGMTFGFAMATMFFSEAENCTLSRIQILLAIIILALLKPAGGLLAAFVLISFLLDVHLSAKTIRSGTDLAVIVCEQKWRWSFAGIASLAFAELSWLCCVKLNPATETLDISSMSNTMHGIPGNSGEIIRTFIARVLQNTERFGLLLISDLMLVIVFLLLLFLLAILRRGGFKSGTQGKTHLVVELSIYTFVYFGAVLLSYLTKFSSFDAMRLASYERYIGTIFLALLFFVFVSLLLLYFRLQNRNVRAAVLLVVFVVLVSFSYKRVPQLLPDNQVAVEEHADYALIVEKISRTIQEPNADIYFIAQNTNGFEWLAFRYHLFPTHVYGHWSIGASYDENDIYTVSMDVADWLKTLEKSYDYLFIYRCDAAFIARYGGGFACRSDIGENRLYRMNRDTKLLELIAAF